MKLKEILEDGYKKDHKFAVIIKGNPKYIKNHAAKDYYHQIAKYIKSKGFEVIFNDGAAYTIPPTNAAFYVAHSRGVDRYEHLPKEAQRRFLKFGTPDGIIDPVDLKWQQERWYPGTDEQPPKEHFIFSNQQRQAIDDMIEKISNTVKT